MCALSDLLSLRHYQHLFSPSLSYNFIRVYLFPHACYNNIIQLNQLVVNYTLFKHSSASKFSKPIYVCPLTFDTISASHRDFIPQPDYQWIVGLIAHAIRINFIIMRITLSNKLNWHAHHHFYFINIQLYIEIKSYVCKCQSLWHNRWDFDT